LQRPFLLAGKLNRGGLMEAEMVKVLKDLSQYSLEKMKLEAEQKEKILVHLNEQVERLSEELAEMKRELSDYRKRFFKLEADYQRLKNEYDDLKMELERHEQKEADR
jgi:chromosome segregation ATPase